MVLKQAAGSNLFIINCSGEHKDNHGSNNGHSDLTFQTYSIDIPQTQSKIYHFLRYISVLQQNNNDIKHQCCHAKSVFKLFNGVICTRLRNAIALFLHLPTLSGTSKILLVLLFGFVSVARTNAALSAKTANTIQGRGPYLTFDGGITQVTNTDRLLGIKLSNGVTYKKSDLTGSNSGTLSNPIELPVAGQAFSDIKTLIPSSLTSVSLHTLIGAPYNYWGDDDGDGSASATGSLNVTLKDVNNNNVGLSDALDGCKSPYTLTLTSTSGTLITQYGDPRTTSFTGDSATYYIKPKINAPYVCYAKPNSTYNNGTQPEWDGANGFKVQNKDTPSSNFPRTGFNGAYFNMTVVGETAATVIAANGDTVNATSGSTNIQLKLTEQSTNVVRVRLSGPSSGQRSGEPSPEGVSMPTEFNLYSDVGHTNKIYSFSLSKWYIPKSGYGGGYPAAQSYCAGLSGSYRVPSVSEYTNANGNNWIWGLSGNGNKYARAIGNGQQKVAVGVDDGKGGLFAEWGDSSSYYSASDWQYNNYWAIEPASSTIQWVVGSDGGGVGATSPSNADVRVACVSP